jgi:hypothetical protein
VVVKRHRTDKAGVSGVWSILKAKEGFMRSRMPVLASACVAAAAMAVPSIAGAAPIHNHALTIHATPNHVIAGEPVLIYGRLQGRHDADQEITLFHRINPATQFTVISRTRTNAEGQYDFPRAEGIVESNRSWFVRGPVFTHSRTVHERVAAEVTINASSVSGTTRHPITFTGLVTPDHGGSRVALQVQSGATDIWHTVRFGRVGAGSTYSIAYAWRTAGSRNVRVAFVGDPRNTAAQSDPITVVIQQRQAPFFTIQSSDPIVTNGSPATITGTLYQPHTSTVAPNVEIGLYSKVPGSGPAALAQTTTTSATGTYSFTVEGDTNELYQARTINAPKLQATAVLFEGVQDTVTMTTSSATSTVGGTVTFSGSVAPSKSGHVVYLEKYGSDGRFHIVETSTISASSTFAFNWTFGTSGTKQFRARVVGGLVNVGGASAPVLETVALPAVSQLPGN